MAKKSIKPAVRRRRRTGTICAAILIAAVAALFGWMYMNARTVHIRRAEVVLSDLPASLNGTTLLYLTDFDLCGTHTAGQAADMLRNLQPLNPDVLLLGGDYTSLSVIERLNGRSGGSLSREKEFIDALASFRAPMGKFAIAGDNDGAPEALALSLSETDVQVIDGSAGIVGNGQDAFAVAGIGARAQNVDALAGKFQRQQCVIALMHSPEQAKAVRIAEAGDGGAWADLLLAGHTQGGQVKLLDRTALTLTETEKRYISGWSHDADAPMLTSQGIGCEGLNLRFGTQPEIWLITLYHESPGMQFTEPSTVR